MKSGVILDESFEGHPWARCERSHLQQMDICLTLERERETSIGGFLHPAPTWDGTLILSMCPGWELHVQPFGLQPTKPHQPGLCNFLRFLIEIEIYSNHNKYFNISLCN